ncbi:sensor histidine kinase [Clostridium rectalis]|uniref:sensor histidine kinase n=1 Tax=Clostridium rectalis TaxID=2040295 RepID=UPI000F639921|nr:HAMP domain-containing sensor histidine kinase [Clostridium rectalis]
MINNKKISNLLLRNYITSSVITFVIFIIFFLTAVIIGLSSYLPINTLMSEENSKLVAENIIRDDYKNIDTKEIERVRGWVEVVDNKFNIIYTKGMRRTNCKKYSKKRFYNMMIDSGGSTFDDDKYMYNVAYNDKKDFSLIVYLPNDNYFNSIINKPKMKLRTFIQLSLFLYFLIFIASMVVYARITSRNLTNPLKKLMKGVKNITNGNYSTRIQLKSRNEFGELRDAFNLMAEKIEEEKTLKEKSEENRRRLIMDISHDLKNPLASIRGYSDLLIKNTDLNDCETTKYLTIIDNNSIRINDLITDLFELSKFESVNFNMEFYKVDICEFLREVIAEYIPLMDEKNFSYEFNIPDKSIFLMINEKSMDRAIGNLIINGIKYNSEGIKIKVTLEEFFDIVEIIIEDNGIGIPKELEHDIFNPFVRVDSSRNSRSGGTGLGLAITKTIIEKHGGRINLYSDINKGSKFIITLFKN